MLNSLNTIRKQKKGDYYEVRLAKLESWRQDYFCRSMLSSGNYAHEMGGCWNYIAVWVVPTGLYISCFLGLSGPHAFQEQGNSPILGTGVLNRISRRHIGIHFIKIW